MMIGLVALAFSLACRLLAWLRRLVAPDVCVACDAPPDGDAVFCRACAATVEPAPEAAPFAPLVASETAREDDVASGAFAGPEIACAAYSGAIATAVRRFKYDGRSDLAGPLGALMERAAKTAALGPDFVVPVPLHPQKLRERGYNQSALLASAVARGTGAPLLATAIERARFTEPQARLDRSARAANVAGAFRVRAIAAVRGRRVLLVDDVATTGATLRACRDALLAAGSASVTTLVLARRPAHST